MRGLPHQIKNFVSSSELNLSKLENFNSFKLKNFSLKIENENTKIQSELSTEFVISFYLFLITFIILSILGTLFCQGLCGVQRSKKDFFGVKKDFYKKVFLLVKKTCVFTSFYLNLKF